MRKVRIFPKLTTSKEEFITHIHRVCKVDIVDEETEAEWIEYVMDSDCCGHYFLNLIYVKHISATVITHEMIHHTFQQLNTLTNTKKFWRLDYMNDALYILLHFRIKPRLKRIFHLR